MAVLLIALGVVLVVVGLVRLQSAPPEGRRGRGRAGGAPPVGEPPGPGAEAAAGTLDPDDPRSAAWAVLAEPVQVEPGLWDQVARRPPLRQFRLGVLLGFGMGLLLAGTLWAVWPAPGAEQPPAGGAAAPAEPGAGAGGAAQPTGPTGPSGGATASGTPATGAGETTAPGTAPGTQPGAQPATQPGAGAAPAAPGPGTAPVSPQEPVTPPVSAEPVTVVVEPGMTAPDVAALLRAQGLIADETAFLNRLAERGLDTLLQAGTFNIPANATLDQVIDLLTAGV